MKHYSTNLNNYTQIDKNLNNFEHFKFNDKAVFGMCASIHTKERFFFVYFVDF